MQCELCGDSTPKTRRFLVEGTRLNVCPNCERFGTALDAPPKRKPATPQANVAVAMERRTKRLGQKDVYASESMRMELVEDYAARIRRARESKGWTRQELGARVGEREVAVSHIETGQLRPVDDIAKRLERELGITLFEPVADVRVPRAPQRGMTLGDVFKDALERADDDA